MPVFIAKYNEHKEELGLEQGTSAELLGTIRVPRNLSLLTERLPAAQYESEKKAEVEGAQYQPMAGQAGARQSNLAMIREEGAQVRQPQTSEKKPPVYNRPPQQYNSGSKVESARLISHQNGQSHSDLLIHN